MQLRLLLFALVLLTGSAWAQWDPNATQVEEICRIRIANKARGLIQVSTDFGRTYWTVGRAKVVANARIPGFAAASYIPRGAVAATAVHGLRIKTGQNALGIGKAQQPLMFSVTPVEFAVIPHFYGGHQPRSAQIVTDIHTGHSIFRNQAPFVGSPVYLEQDGRLVDLPEDYVPAGGEIFVILVQKPTRLPRDIVFENREGGAVTLNWPDGRTEQLTTVVRPVKGIGRYDGTTFTGTGSINTNHGGVITIDTAPLCPLSAKEGGPVETRGGFMIQPSYHVREQGETSPQVMVVGPKNPRKPSLEGTPPLFRGYINLWRYSGHPDASYRVEVRHGSGEWVMPPPIVGRVDDALADVTAVRLSFPKFDPKLLADDIACESAAYTRATAAGARGFRGTITLQPKRPCKSADVYYYVDGALVGISNRPPYTYNWDTTRVPNGFHDLAIRTVPPTGEPIIESREVVVLN
jgi:hypothetical protein